MKSKGFQENKGIITEHSGDTMELSRQNLRATRKKDVLSESLQNALAARERQKEYEELQRKRRIELYYSRKKELIGHAAKSATEGIDTFSGLYFSKTDAFCNAISANYRKRITRITQISEIEYFIRFISATSFDLYFRDRSKRNSTIYCMPVSYSAIYMENSDDDSLVNTLKRGARPEKICPTTDVDFEEIEGYYGELHTM